MGKVVVNHGKALFFAMGSKKLPVWLPPPVREFSQSGATENEGPTPTEIDKPWGTTFEELWKYMATSLEKLLFFGLNLSQHIDTV